MSELEEKIEAAIEAWQNDLDGNPHFPEAGEHGLAQAIAQALRSTDPQCVVVKELVWTFDRVDDQWSVWHRAGHPDIVIDTETAEQIEIMLGLRYEAEVKAEGVREGFRRALDAIHQTRGLDGHATAMARGMVRLAEERYRSQSSEGEG